MKAPYERICVAWSGGKDSFLALCLAEAKFSAATSSPLLVTFVPQYGHFRCHPLGLLEAQGAAMGLQHVFVEIDLHHWKRSYSLAFEHLRDVYGVRTVVTGDIFAHAEHLQDYWLHQILSSLDINLYTPLLGFFAEEILSLLAVYRIRAIVSGMASQFYCVSVLGQPLELRLLTDAALHNQVDFDMCGERGDYHTTVTAFGEKVFSSDDFGRFDHSRFGSVWTLALGRDLLHPKAQRMIVSPGKGD